MRALCIVVAVLAVLAGASSANAQRGKGPQGGDSGNSATDAMKAQIAAKDKEAKDKAYQDALKRIPASSEKQDPWKNAR